MKNYFAFFFVDYQRNLHISILQFVLEVIQSHISHFQSCYKVKSKPWLRTLKFSLILWLCLHLATKPLDIHSCTLKVDPIEEEAETILVEEKVLEGMDSSIIISFIRIFHLSSIIISLYRIFHLESILIKLHPLLVVRLIREIDLHIRF